MSKRTRSSSRSTVFKRPHVAVSSVPCSESESETEPPQQAYPQPHLPEIRHPQPPVHYPPVLHMATYIPSQVSLLRCRRLVFMDEFFSLLDTASDLPFTVKAARDDLLNCFRGLHRYTVDRLLQKGEIVVELSDSGVSRMVNRLITNLDIGERDGEVVKNFDDKVLSFRKTVEALLIICAEVDPDRAAAMGVYDREHLEMHFRLQVAAQPMN